MRWIVLSELPHEDLKSDPTFDWAIRPQFCRIEWENDEEELELRWTVSLMHRHWGSSDDTESLYEDSKSPPDMFRCGISNREDVTQRGEFPEYACDKCGKKVPKNVVEEKLDRLRSLKGVDPRNDRRGAVLATREANLLDTKES
jgi:hypothetical protein